MRFVAMFFGVFSVVYVGRHMAVFEKRGYRHAEFFIFYFFLKMSYSFVWKTRPYAHPKPHFTET